MNKYLEKIAETEEYKPTLKDRTDAFASSGMGSLAALPFMGATKLMGEALVAREEADKGFSKADLSTIKKTVTEDGLRGKITFISPDSAARVAKHKTESAVGGGNGLFDKIKKMSVFTSREGGAAYFPKFGGEKGAVLPGAYKNVSSTLHEIGHANLDSKAKGITSGLRTGGNVVAAGSGLMLLSGDQDTRDKALVAYGLGKAPELLDEAQANLYAARKLQKHQGGKVALKHAPKLALGMGTYLSNAAGGATALYVGKKIADNVYKSREAKFEKERSKSREQVSTEDS